MADLSRSILRNQASSATLSKKLSNVNSFTGKNVYDNVIATPTKFGTPTFSSRVEDYSEIFGSSQSSRTSSIPILDLPAIDKREVSVDVRSSKFDYSKIFGGFGDVDFSVAYEELVTKLKDGDISSEEARTPAKTGPPSEGSDLSKCPENKFSSHEVSYQSFDGMKQFNMSYNRSNLRSKDGTNGTTHIAQLHAVPGFTCIIDGVTPLQSTEGNKPVPSINDVSPTVDINEGIMEGKHCRKAPSHLPNCGANRQTFEDNVKFRSGWGWNESNSNDTSFHAHEIGLKADRSEVMRSPSMASNLSNGNGASKRAMASKSKASQSDAFEGAAGDCSPTYFDEEVDVNSAAAVSAAAVRKAIEKAQARIRIAKESMEKKKKEGLQSCVKQSFKDGLKVERREVKIADEANRFKDKKPQEIRERENTTMQDLSGTERQNATRTGHVDLNFKDWEKHYLAKKAVGETNGKESKPTPVNHSWEGEEWEAEKQSCEFLDTRKYIESTLAFEQADIKKKEMQSVDEYELKIWRTTEERFEVPELNGKKLNAVEEAFEREESEGKLNGVNGEQEWAEHENKLKSAEEIHEQEESEERLMAAQERNGIEEKLKASHEQEKSEKKSKESQEPIQNEKKLEAQKWEENENKKSLKEDQKQLEIEMERKESYEKEENEKRLKEVRAREENEKILEDLREQKEYEKRLKQPCEWVEHEKKPTGSCWWEENEKKQEDAHTGEDYENGSDEVHEQEQRLNDPHERDENEKEDCEWEGYEELEEAQKQEENDKMLKETCEWEESERIQRETHQSEENLKNIKETQEALWYEEKNHQATYDACKQGESEDLSRNQETCTYNNNDVEVTQEVLVHDRNWRIVKATKASCEPEENEEELKAVKVAIELEEKDMFKTASRAEGALEHNKFVNNVKDESAAFLFEGNVVNELEEREKKARAVKSMNELEEKEMFRTACWVQGALECNKIGNNMEDGSEAFLFEENEPEEAFLFEENEPEVTFLFEENEPEEAFLFEENDEESGAVKLANELEDKEMFKTACLAEDALEHDDFKSHMEDECEAILVDDAWANSGETDMNVGQNQNDQKNKESRSACSLGKHIEKLAQELGNDKNVNEAEVAFDQVEEKNNFVAANGEKQWVENGEKMEAVHLNSVFDGKGKTLEIAQDIQKGQSTEQTKENLDETLTMEEKEAKETVQKEVELEKEHHRNIYEVKERKKWERERDRIAVERAIREARERAFAEARERAERAAVERATAEARQRVMAGARERLEKASAEVKDKSIAQKASMEAKIKAERAAVERATAEARERALEKSLSGKAAPGARGPEERFVAEKFSGSSGDSGMRQSFSSPDSQHQGSGPSSSLRYSSSSNYGVPQTTDRYDNGARSESAQSCKARLESHQRIAERAAKALAEKNKRDLLAQKEQAERNRLAESLDADVKRWSSGKSGNLRALLSTLQYILGPNSGWQSIPLTEIITTSAVKKAYRKATLFVHPDKLQQRGASIRQKYICEKVFDLLKEAWNKFSLEEL